MFYINKPYWGNNIKKVFIQKINCILKDDMI